MVELPRLLHFRISHYNEKVRWALDLKHVAHVREALVPGFHVPRVRFLTKQNKVPVLVLDGEPWAGSAQILDILERRWPSPPLYSDDPTLRERALALERHFDDQVAPEVRRLFWSYYFDHPAECARLATDGFGGGSYATFRALYWVLKPAMKRSMGSDAASVEAAREHLQGHFEHLERELGGREYLVAGEFGVADLTAAAILSPVVRPREFPYPPPEPWPAGLRELRESVRRRAGFEWVEAIYARHRGASAEVH